MAEVELVRVSKRFRDGTLAVSDLSMTIEDGEFLVLVGPSGCGKSTALRMIAGLETVTAGEVRIDGHRVNEVSPAKRDIAMVFQNYALYPHMTVRKNLEIGLKLRGMAKRERRERVAKIATMLGIEQYLNRRPAMLSGGQRQRVAMGRAIVREPAVFLLDEPLSNLDAKLRMEVRAEIKLLQAELHTTTIFVTHDQVEALTMAHRIAVMRKGLLQQMGSPENLYSAPDNLFVAGFIGAPPMNFLRGSISVGGDGDVEVLYGAGNSRWQLPPWAANGSVLRSLAGEDLVIGIRPEHLTVAQPADSAAGDLEGTVRLVESLGSDTLVYVDVKAPPVMVDQIQEALAADDEDAAAPGAQVGAAASGATRLCVRVPENARFDLGEEVRLAPLRGSLHAFALQSGRRLGSVEAPRAARPAAVG